MTKHAKNKQLKQIQNQSQSGRSMIEMLGVLAIIAVLSIGGIIMFRYAMNYYQADQIAHEMNMMRTDAQIKIAQGTEKLTLGSPYDPLNESTLGHIQFNDDYPVDFACALADDETVELSNISCHVANAYYIELQNIPEGVCRPLAELVNGMNNIIAFNVNKNEYPGEGKCEAGNENVLNAVFSAEAVSELKVCTEDTDCESENAPHCDPSRHVCVRCYEDNQCEHNQYCEDNTCVTCESGVWNGEDCVECTADDDCTNSDKPVCNTAEYKCVECLTYSDCTDTPETPQCDEASHTCKSCAEIDLSKPVWADTQCVECVESTDCEETLVCRGNECTTCQTEDECQAKGTTYHCSNASTCIQCAANEVWDDESRECVECTADDDCADTPDTPKCNTATNQCVQCLNNDDCKNPTPICSEENTCVACKTNDECRLKNPSEENCTENGACCDDPLMTWTNGECVCPKDYAKSETSSGKAVCLPYCKQEVGIVLLIDRSSSTRQNPPNADNDNKYEAKINKALDALTIPEELKIAVYLDDGTSEETLRNPLPYSTYSAETIKSKIHDYQLRYAPGGTNFTPALKHISSTICTSQEKLLIIMWTDADLDATWGINSQDTDILAQIKNQNCPGSKFYFIAPRNAFSSITDSFFPIDDLPESYAGILNEVIQQEGCVKRK